MAMDFYCSQCGKCCEVAGFWNPELDDGKGACKFYDWEKKLCSDYENRPDICNTTKAYSAMVESGFYENMEHAGKVHEKICKDLEKKEQGTLGFDEFLAIVKKNIY